MTTSMMDPHSDDREMLASSGSDLCHGKESEAWMSHATYPKGINFSGSSLILEYALCNITCGMSPKPYNAALGLLL